MHFSALVQQAATRVRPKSMQFDRAVTPDNSNRRAASRDRAARHVPPGTRTSSLPTSHTRHYTDIPARPYRSMLHVERPPKLPMAKPLSYGELYPLAPEPVVELRAPSTMSFHRQAPRVSQHTAS